MNIYGINISKVSFEFINSFSTEIELFELNEILKDKTGCVNFFDDKSVFSAIKSNAESSFAENNKAEFGDFQTNLPLAKNIVNKLIEDNINPDFIIEPTCGKGNFILASLDKFNNVETIFGIEIQEQYCLQAKFNILDYYLTNNKIAKTEIRIINASIFDYDFTEIKKTINNKNILILGNPPWVTNSQLGSLESQNIPAKSNRKNVKGLDAMTGKGNFDIAEFITYKMFESFMKCNGNLAFLVKNTVVKNIVENQKSGIYNISDLSKGNIDSKKEFNAAVDASLFYCKLNSRPTDTCEEYDFYTQEHYKTFGWYNKKFVNDIHRYKSTGLLDGKCQFEWRQGIKHDCAQVMELVKKESNYLNKQGKEIKLESDLVYPFLKSSDLKELCINDVRKYTIVTQRYVGENTKYISQYPSTYEYLNQNIDFFRNRKSSIYKGKSDFSIFGIGDYSFKPFKVAISGLYKTYHFTLVTPFNGKPVMLDDTCYFIGFDCLEDAIIAQFVLNSDIVRSFLMSITFPDSKRMITKEILMRIDMQKALSLLNKELIINTLANRVDFSGNQPNKMMSSFEKKYLAPNEMQMCLF